MRAMSGMAIWVLMFGILEACTQLDQRKYTWRWVRERYDEFVHETDIFSRWDSVRLNGGGGLECNFEWECVMRKVESGVHYEFTNGSR